MQTTFMMYGMMPICMRLSSTYHLTADWLSQTNGNLIQLQLFRISSTGRAFSGLLWWSIAAQQKELLNRYTPDSLFETYPIE